MYDFLSRLFAIISNFYINKGTNEIYKFEDYFRKMSDEQLRAECDRYRKGEEMLVEKDKGANVVEALFKILESITTFFSPKAVLDMRVFEHVALANEVFSRYPADLPAGSTLYPEQLSAAISLTQHCLVQMDTGEGKTYAILPAAFSLVCQYSKVFIICPNSYLATRDAFRTQSFWNFMGLRVGLCIDSDERNEDWNCPVVYTTMEALIFAHLMDDSNPLIENAPLKLTSAIIDEADSVLLDSGAVNYHVVRQLSSEAYDWAFALYLVEHLTPAEHILEDFGNLSCSLTLQGEAWLREQIAMHTGNMGNYLLVRQTVEWAYVGRFMVKEGRHYIIQNNKIYAIELLTGRIAYNVRPNWIHPLEFHFGYPPSNEKIFIHRLSVINFFSLFAHFSGISGSIIDDLGEYFFSYGLYTILIPPRNKRFDGLQRDNVYKTSAEAVEALIEKAKEELQKGRPILIGVQNINAAEDIFRRLGDDEGFVAASRFIHLVTGKNEADIADIFEEAGQDRAVTIATQLAGRGVDIRLSEAARASGGLALLCLEHSQTMRHDKQFLGRAGRQGDPFIAFYFVSLEDEFMRLFDSASISTLMEKLGYKKGEKIEHSMVDKSIIRAQNKLKLNQFLERRGTSIIEMAEGEVYRSFKVWVGNLHTSQEKANIEEPENYHIGAFFSQWIVSKYVKESLAPLLTNEFTSASGDIIATKIRQDLQLDLKTVKLEGRKKENVIGLLEEMIGQSLAAASQRWEAKLNKNLEEWENAQSWISQLQRDMQDLLIVEDRVRAILSELKMLDVPADQNLSGLLIDTDHHEDLLHKTNVIIQYDCPRYSIDVEDIPPSVISKISQGSPLNISELEMLYLFIRIYKQILADIGTKKQQIVEESGPMSNRLKKRSPYQIAFMSFQMAGSGI